MSGIGARRVQHARAHLLFRRAVASNASRFSSSRLPYPRAGVPGTIGLTNDRDCLLSGMSCRAVLFIGRGAQVQHTVRVAASDAHIAPFERQTAGAAWSSPATAVWTVLFSMRRSMVSCLCASPSADGAVFAEHFDVWVRVLSVRYLFSFCSI